MSDFGFYLCITVLTIFCWGDPDLLDGLIAATNGVECTP